MQCNCQISGVAGSARSRSASRNRCRRRGLGSRDMAASAARDLQARPNHGCPRKTASRGGYVVTSVSAVPRARGNAAGSGRAPRALAGSTAAWDSFVVLRPKCAIATVDLHSPRTRHDALRRCAPWMRQRPPGSVHANRCRGLPRMAAGCPAARRAAYSTRGGRARRWEAGRD